MRRLARIILAGSLLGTPVLTACAPPPSNDSAAAVIIDYSAAFVGQAASGYLNLVVDMTIENRGDDPFNTTPDNFAVEVNDYSYKARESDLPAVELESGDTVSGRLHFQVPPAAATTRVGYTLVYSGAGGHDVEWRRQPDPLSGNTQPAQPVVEITYYGSADGEYMWESSTRTLYLLVDVTITNRGYESFNTSPEYFSLVIGRIFGQSTPEPPIKFDGGLSEERDEAYSDLRSYDLQNGGTLAGTLAFKVPRTILAATEPYRLEYSGLRAYNIQWFRGAPKQ
jgi:hypothetical protein